MQTNAERKVYNRKYYNKVCSHNPHFCKHDDFDHINTKVTPTQSP